MSEKSRIYNSRTQVTLGIQDTGNIGHTRHRKHWAYKTQVTLGIQDTGNIGHTTHRKHWAYKTQETLGI